MNSLKLTASTDPVDGSVDGIATRPAMISALNSVDQQSRPLGQLPDRRCFAVLGYLMRYRSLKFIDLFLLRQGAVGTCSFKDPENVLKQNSCFNFRDAFTRELSVNLVASLNEPARYSTPEILRRPWFDIERVEIPAHKEAKARVLVGKGTASLHVAPLETLPFLQWKVSEALQKYRERGTANWAMLWPLFLQDSDNLELLESLVCCMEKAEMLMTAEQASFIYQQAERWSYYSTRGLAAVNHVKRQYASYLFERHSAKTATARLERLLPTGILSSRVSRWRRLADCFTLAGERIRKMHVVQSTGFKKSVLEILEHPSQAVSLPQPICQVLDYAYRKAISEVTRAVSRSGRWAKMDEFVILERFGAHGSRRSRLFVMNILITALNRGADLVAMPEADLERIAKHETSKLLADDLADWLGSSSPETISLQAFPFTI